MRKGWWVGAPALPGHRETDLAESEPRKLPGEGGGH